MALSQKVQDWDFDKFPIDLKQYKPIPLDPVNDKKLSDEQKEGLVRDKEIQQIDLTYLMMPNREPTLRFSVTSFASSLLPVPLEESLDTLGE